MGPSLIGGLLLYTMGGTTHPHKETAVNPNRRLFKDLRSGMKEQPPIWELAERCLKVNREKLPESSTFRPWCLTISTRWPVPATLANGLDCLVVEDVPVRWGLGLTDSRHSAQITLSLGWQTPGPLAEVEKRLWVDSPHTDVKSWVPIHVDKLRSVEWSKALIHFPQIHPPEEVFRTLRGVLGSERRLPHFWADLSIGVPALAHYYTVIKSRWIALAFEVSLAGLTAIAATDPAFKNDLATEIPDGQ